MRDALAGCLRVVAHLEDSVARVAELCGYSAEASLRKAFRQYAGIGPGAVMKKQGLEPGDNFQQRVSAYS